MHHYDFDETIPISLPKSRFESLDRQFLPQWCSGYLLRNPILSQWSFLGIEASSFSCLRNIKQISSFVPCSLRMYGVLQYDSFEMKIMIAGKVM